MSGPNSPRGTTNRNQRGNTIERAARRQWLLDTYGDGKKALCEIRWDLNCLEWVTSETITVDRHPIPGIDGGTYARNNIRPACGPCNSRAGIALREARKQAQKFTPGEVMTMESVDALTTKVLHEHLLTGPRTGQCRCGWGDGSDLKILGRDHTMHVTEKLREAGVLNVLPLRTAKVLPEHGEKYCGEMLGSAEVQSAGGSISFRSACGYPFSTEGICVNRENHADPEACLGDPTR